MDRRNKYEEMYGKDYEDFIDESVKYDYHEEYFNRKDPLGKAILFGNENELYMKKIIMSIAYIEPSIVPDNSYDYLYKALDELREKSLVEYSVITSLFFDSASVKEIALDKGKSLQSVYKILSKALEHLKPLVIKQKNKKECA